MRAFAICLIVPVLWALCFAACAAVSLNAISFNGATVLNTLLQPLVAIVLLWVMLRLPTHLARVAMLGAAPLGGGFVSRAVSYAAGSQIRDSAKAHLPSWAGGHTTHPDTNSSQAESRTGSRLRTAATLAGATATAAGTATTLTAATTASRATGAGAVGTSAATPAQAANGRAYTPPPTAQANTAGRQLQHGLQTPSFAGREQDFANETFEAQYRERTSPVSAQQASAALQTLPADTQRAVAQLVSDHGAGAREHLAYQAIGEWSPQEREALRTLAAANPQVRQEAINHTLHPGSHDQAAHRVTDPRDGAHRAREPSTAVTDRGGSGQASGAVTGVSVDAPASAPDQTDAATQSGWSHVDTTAGAPRETPSGPPTDQPAPVAGNGSTQPPGAPPPAPPASSQLPGAGAMPPGRQPTAREPRDPNPNDPFPNE